MATIPFTTTAFAHYLETHTDHPDFTLLQPKFYVNYTKPQSLIGHIDPQDDIGEFLMVYPADLDAHGRFYSLYLPATYYRDGSHSFWDHDECRRFTELHHLGFRRIALDAMPLPLLQGFGGFWHAFLDDLHQSVLIA